MALHLLTDNTKMNKVYVVERDEFWEIYLVLETLNFKQWDGTQIE
jgi:hypothetical protein